YEHPNYQGRCVKFTGDAPDLRTVGFDDTASSLRILGSWTATLYRDLSGTGVSSTFTADDANLADDAVGDNQATSVSVRRTNVPSANACDGGEGVYLYEHPNYQGRCIKLTSDAGDLRSYNFDDIVSSVRVVGNWTATLYRDLYGTGISSTFTQNDPNVADDAIGDNQATSASVRRR
ncbi:MAG: beta/gamma crystallin-related protein, partial [Roseiflexaceae bacterium]